jgi:hypothetical protein
MSTGYEQFDLDEPPAGDIAPEQWDFSVTIDRAYFMVHMYRGRRSPPLWLLRLWWCRVLHRPLRSFKRTAPSAICREWRAKMPAPRTCESLIRDYDRATRDCYNSALQSLVTDPPL